MNILFHFFMKVSQHMVLKFAQMKLHIYLQKIEFFKKRSQKFQRVNLLKNEMSIIWLFSNGF